MLDLVDLFKEPNTVDELGIAPVRDAFSNALFPGTAYQQDEIRYVLFVAYLLRRSACKETPARMIAEFQQLERQLVGSLQRGGVLRYIIGVNSASRRASSVYWSPVVVWGLRTSGISYDQFFRRNQQLAQLRRDAPANLDEDDPTAREALLDDGLDPWLPPEPPDLLEQTTFVLQPKEVEYLRDRIAESTNGSLLGWLVQNPPGNLSSELRFVWEIDNLQQAPADAQELVAHARRFMSIVFGASLVYNKLLIDKKLLLGSDPEKWQGRAAAVNTNLDQWREQVGNSDVRDGWSSEWWSDLRARKPQVMSFVDGFVRRWDSEPEAESWVREREIQTKQNRAGLRNPAALDRWDGTGEAWPQEFRWSVARNHLLRLWPGGESL